MSEEVELSWAAGIIDGEGHIGIARIPAGYNRTKNDSFLLFLRLGMNHLETVKRFAQILDAQSDIKVRSDRKANHNDTYEVNFAARNAERALRSVFLYLVTKKEQAELAFKFRDTFSQHRSGRTPQDVVDFRRSRWEEMQVLNKRGVA